MKVLHIVGARPNFPKLAPVHRALAAAGIQQLVVHTGQHYDESLSAGFFRDLGIPQPDMNLAVGSGTHAQQTARVMERVEPVLCEARPDWTVLYGDVNSTLAAAVVASKLGLRLAHVEAGLRSGDRTMPEEINRIVTDRLADLLLTPSRDADVTLLREGEARGNIVFVGNVMIDSLFFALGRARGTGFRRTHGLGENEGIIVTLHRPSNVDDPVRLRALVDVLRSIALDHAVIFPAHPRTMDRLAELGIDLSPIRVLPPVGYLEMIDLVAGARAVITDSGGLQEETTALGIPCFTVRDNTERPITVTEGTNQLVRQVEDLCNLVELARRRENPRRPEGWDGHAAERIRAALIEHHAERNSTVASS